MLGEVESLLNHLKKTRPGISRNYQLELLSSGKIGLDSASRLSKAGYTLVGTNLVSIYNLPSNTQKPIKTNSGP
jgi:hypothetical protein